MSHVIVLDPGHGGDRAAGGSTSNRSRGPNGLLEKDVALDIAKRVASALSSEAEVRLTRQGDTNLSLSERAAVAYNASADAFVSLHWNSSADIRRNAVEAFVARDAAAGSRALAADLMRRVAEATEQEAGPLHSRDLGVLVTKRHRASTRSCLVELGYLTHPAQAMRLEQGAYRDRVAQAIAKALIERLRSGHALESALDAGDGPPSAMRKNAVDECWSRCQEFAKTAKQATNPAAKSAAEILKESGVKADANPYLGITKDEIEAIVRAANTSRQPPEVLLALWVKEGSSRSVTSPLTIPEANTSAHAKTLFRCKVYYEDMGIDHFIVTTRPVTGGDTVYDKRDSAADGHQKHFKARIDALVKDSWLNHDISGDVDAELKVSGSKAGSFAVVPTTRFYALSLLLADALYTKFMNNKYAELPGGVPQALNYMQWNMGADTFKKFLESAEKHRKEPAYTAGGTSIDIDTWALHRKPKSNEYAQARTNAIRFMHYVNSYRPIFAGSMSSIQPGLLDLQRVPKGTYIAETLQQATGPRMHHWVLLSNPYRKPEETVRKILEGAGLPAKESAAIPAASLTPLVRLMDVLSDSALEDMFAFLNFPANKLYPQRVTGKALTAGMLKDLAARLLITLPGHAREVARSVNTAEHAYFIENLGWLMMHAVRNALESKGEPKWWVPPLPAFASRFRTGAPGAPDWVRDLARRFNLIDAAVTEKEAQAKCDIWRNGLAGQQWRLETGHTTTKSTEPLGLAFYPSLIASRLPITIDTAAVRRNKAAIDTAWVTRKADVAKAKGANTDAERAELRTIVVPAVYSQAGIQARASLSTMRMLGGKFPQVDGARTIVRDRVTVLGGLHPMFEAVFRALAELGWNDLIFFDGGAMVFRGIRNNDPSDAYVLSNHAYGAAIDVQSFENPTGNANRTIHRRLVAVFKAFSFRWGGDYTTVQVDPHHFDVAT